MSHCTQFCKKNSKNLYLEVYVYLSNERGHWIRLVDGERDFLKKNVLSLSFPDSHAPTISALEGRPRYVHRAGKWCRIHLANFRGKTTTDGISRDKGVAWREKRLVMLLYSRAFGCMNARDSGA